MRGATEGKQEKHTNRSEYCMQFMVRLRNSLSFLKKQVHYVAKATHGAGVEELIDKLTSSGVAAGSPEENRNSIVSTGGVISSPAEPARFLPRPASNYSLDAATV